MPVNEISLSGATLAELTEATLAKGASFRFKAKGCSMSPFIKDDDVITISPAPGSSLGFGKPAAFINPKTGKFAVHRIVGGQKDRYLLKGDNAPHADGLITRENILGIVTKVERCGKSTSLGLGPERRLIAFLSRSGFLNLIFWCWRIIPHFLRKFLL